MARLNVIILDKPDRANPNIFRYALWASVPAARQGFYAIPNYKSLWIDALPSDNADLQAGRTTEKIDTIQVAQGTGIAAVEAELQVRWQAFQDDVNNNNPWVRYGSIWNGIAWTITGVA